MGYYSELPGFIDSYYPGREVRKDVNSGSRTGGRIAFRFEPSETFTITPRVVYQKLETDGYPRIDVYNILGNIYTTTEPAVDPGERGQVTQIREGLTDEFMLADLKLDFDFGSVGMTAVTSYTDRNVEVVRDASQLTGSVTKDLGGTDAQARLDSPLIDNTDLQVFSQEIRLRLHGRRSVPVGGWRVLSAVRPRVRADPADARLRRADAVARSAPTAPTSTRRPTRRSTPISTTISSSSACSVKLPIASARTGR